MPAVDLVTYPALKEANEIVKNSSFCVRTPLVKIAPGIFDFIDHSVELYLKLENMQNTGSFKARGVANQLHHLPEDCLSGKRRMVTFSAGNYGRAFAMGTSELGLKGLVIMPDMAPMNRAELISTCDEEALRSLRTDPKSRIFVGSPLISDSDTHSCFWEEVAYFTIQSYGAEVERRPNCMINERLSSCVKEGMYLAHPFDDLTIIAGYGSIAFEILDDLPDPDVVITCCGGGGMLAGMAAGFKLMAGNHARIYGAEPEQAPTMYMSLAEGRAVTYNKACSIAAGLAPPAAGELTYAHSKAFVDGIALVSEEDIVRNMFRLYRHGLLVEPSGAAAFAAIAENKVPDLHNKKVVVVISGANMTIDELNTYGKQFPHLVLK